MRHPHASVFMENGKGGGLFNPHTPSGTIVVDGVLSSCYTASYDQSLAHLGITLFLIMRPITPQWILDRYVYEILDSGFTRGGEILKSLDSTGKSVVSMLTGLVQASKSGGGGAAGLVSMMAAAVGTYRQSSSPTAK